MENIFNGTQGSPAWHAYRSEHFNASDAPAMMGVSPYKSRSELLKEYATGMAEEIDSPTQARFNDGHRFEILARPLAEEIIGEQLYPVVGSTGKLSASFDGITLDESVIFEHKTANADILTAVKSSDLGAHLRVQMEQQLYISGAEKCLFMATRWGKDDALTEKVTFWYSPDLELRAKIIAGWKQFAIDLANYERVEVIEKTVAAIVKDLPALSIQVNGSLSLVSNLDKYGFKLKEFVEQLDMTPSDDQGFADADMATKILKEAEERLDAAEASGLSQVACVDEMQRTVKLYRDIVRNARLALEKVVKARKESIKIDIAQEVKTKFSDHIAALNKRLGGQYMPQVMADFSGAMKGLKTISSIRNAVDTELARAKIEANEIADKLQMNLETLRTMAENHKFLFADVMQIITKDNSHLALLIQARIEAHERAESEKAEALRVKIEAQERAKAEAAAAETLRKEREVAEAIAKPAPVVQEQRTAAPMTNTIPLSPVSVANISESSALINLGTINAKLGVTASSEFLSTLGFIAVQQKNARLYREIDFPAICSAISQYVLNAARNGLKAAA